MYINLKAEMVRHGVSDAIAAKEIGISERTFRNKISGRSEFGVRQAMQIRKKFFPELGMEYLFEEGAPTKTA